MKLKKLALRVGVVLVLGSMLGGCIVVPYGRGGGYRHYSEPDRGGGPRDRDYHDDHRR